MEGRAIVSLATPFKISIIDALTSQNFDFRSQCSKTKLKLASWSSGNAFTSVARGSNLVQLKLDTVLPTARHRRNIFSKEAMLPRCNDVELGTPAR